MNSIDERISGVLADRRRLLPEVDREIAAWERVRNCLGRLDGAATAVRESPDGPPAGMEEIDLPGTGRRVAEVLAALAAVRARVSRQTINIGVRGWFEIIWVDLCVGSVWRVSRGFAVDSDHSMA